MKILLIDNYDSFTYNLAHILRGLNVQFDVIRNDKIRIEDVSLYDGIIYSPGPGIPSEAGQMKEIIKTYAGNIPMLGICLGHQAIGEYLGSRLVNRKKVLHGVKTNIKRTRSDDVLLNGLSDQLDVGRYHSWEIDPDSKTEGYVVTAVDDEGAIMAIESEDKMLFGMQFHPESIMTEKGPQMIINFLELCKPVLV